MADDKEPTEAIPRVGGLMVAYLLARLGIFAIVAIILWMAGLKGLPGLLTAALASIPLSYLFLGKWRTEVATRIQQRHEAKLRLRQEWNSDA